MPSPGPAPHDAARADADRRDAGVSRLAIDGLTITVDTPTGAAEAVSDVSLSLEGGATLGLVGESGSGKSLTALATIGLLPAPARVTAGRIRLDGVDLLALRDEEAWREVRGGRIGFVFQEPALALNPVLTIGYQIAETLVAHGRADWRTARAQAVDWLAAVQVPDPARRAREYPHQLSGGLRQRAHIAMALCCRPTVLVADEPTSALDATVQAELLDLLADLRERHDLAILLVTHDLGVVARATQRVAVMYAGRIVEAGPTAAVLREPGHPYTRGLLAAIPGGTPGTPLAAMPGSVPAPGRRGPGCAFAARCPHREPRCEVAPPATVAVAPDHAVRCVLHG
jgi:peptide/nickel transport system ATP-binding protein/oligopeptide transport system ATP-binding protein